MPVPESIPQTASQHASVVAAAGCGKTQSIVSEVNARSSGRALVLTHTHAGVAALRSRFLKMGVPASKYRVETLDGWSWRWSKAYPTLSGVGDAEPLGNDWPRIRASTLRLLDRRHVREVISASYDALFADEYQDCSPEQHDIVVRLASILPCRVFGDPLQAIFAFGSNKVVDWATQVEPSFPRETELTTPHRWNGKNPTLGSWLGDVRTKLLTGQSIDLRSSPVRWVRSSGTTWTDHITACWRVLNAAGRGEYVAAIHQWPPQSHKFAKNFKGNFSIVEPIECKDLLHAADLIDKSTGSAQAVCLIDFAKKCMAKAVPTLNSMRKSLDERDCLEVNRYQNKKLANALADVATKNDIAHVPRALEIVRKLDGAYLSRPEPFAEMIRAGDLCVSEGFSSLHEAAIAVRESTRRRGRRPRKSCLGRTLLLKGLEFDHVIVLDAHRLDRNNLYVALTRASRSLTVVSPNPVLSPAAT